MKELEQEIKRVELLYSKLEKTENGTNDDWYYSGVLKGLREALRLVIKLKTMERPFVINKDGNIFPVWKIIFEDDTIHVWCEKWPGHHIIEIDCEWYAPPSFEDVLGKEIGEMSDEEIDYVGDYYQEVADVCLQKKKEQEELIKKIMEADEKDGLYD